MPLVGLVVCVLLVVFRQSVLSSLASPLLEDDGPRKSDAALVLGGDNWGTRIIRAGELVRAGYAPYAYVSGPQAFGAHESDFTIHYAVDHGLPASFFRALPNNCEATEMEAHLFGNIFRQNGVHSVLLVTSNYHTHRAAYLMRKFDPFLRITVVPAPDPTFSVDNWWKTREGRKIFLLEWMKTAASYLGV